ncbi:hypothetical protein F2Q70_00042879 [Brassica cretica]|uniref:Uncharacterized protein n=1 Tax=Brassica cretica TaxID=69181 RepID=A0A8S9KMB9_BRACR|nr:hypothetical protein F2Q70_00042879 [Brassica cretica]
MESAGTNSIKNLKVEKSFGSFDSRGWNRQFPICKLDSFDLFVRPKLLPDQHELIVFGKIDKLDRVHRPTDCDDTDDEDELAAVMKKDDGAAGSRRWSSDEEIRRSRGREGPAVLRGLAVDKAK